MPIAQHHHLTVVAARVSDGLVCVVSVGIVAVPLLMIVTVDVTRIVNPATIKPLPAMRVGRVRSIGSKARGLWAWKGRAYVGTTRQEKRI